MMNDNILFLAVDHLHDMTIRWEGGHVSNDCYALAVTTVHQALPADDHLRYVLTLWLDDRDFLLTDQLEVYLLDSPFDK